MKRLYSTRIIGCCIALVAGACRDQGLDVAPASVSIVATPAGALTMKSGATLHLVAVVKNAAGTELTGSVVEWTTSDQMIATVSATGVVTGVHVGEATIVARAGDVRSTAAAVSVVPGVPSRIVVRTQPAGAASGIALTTQPVVELRDAAGNVASTSVATVTATIATGGGTILGSTVTTVDGVATFTALTLSGTIGDRTLLFSAPGVSSVTSIGLGVAPGALARLAIRTQPSGAVSGTALTTQPVVELRDAAGNLLTTSAATVTAGIGNGTGTLVNATATASNGLATFSGLAIVGTPGDRTLTFSAPGAPTISSTSFALSSGSSAAISPDVHVVGVGHVRNDHIRGQARP